MSNLAAVRALPGADFAGFPDGVSYSSEYTLCQPRCAEFVKIFMGQHTSAALIRDSPIDLWPTVTRRLQVPRDTEETLVKALELRGA